MNIEKFLEIEKKYNLYYLDVEEINYWEYSRFEIWNYVLCAEKLELHSPHRKRKLLYAFTLIGSMFSSFFQYIKSKKQTVDVCFISHERRIKENDVYDCMYTEDLVKKFPNSIVLESPHNYGHLTPVNTQNLYYTDWIVIIGNLYAMVHLS